MNNIEKEFIYEFEKLSSEKKEEVIDFIAFLNSKEKEDATEYLFSTEANKKYLIQSIEEVENEEDLIEVNLEDLKKGIFPKI